MRLAMAQLASGEDRGRNLGRCLEVMGEARRRGAEVIVFPELVLDRFFPHRRGDETARALAENIPGPATDKVAERARELGLVTVFNLYEVDGEGRTFDSSPVFDADGSLLGVTRMIHVTDFEGFHERDYYHPGDRGAPVYDTRAGRLGVAICYDRHYPEYTRALAAGGAEVIVIPQAGTVGEWPEGLYEAEVRTLAFQNGVFAALCNRVGKEERLEFAGESFAVDPDGRVIARGKSGDEDLLIADLELGQVAASCGKRLFWRDRRPELYPGWLAIGEE